MKKFEEEYAKNAREIIENVQRYEDDYQRRSRGTTRIPAVIIFLAYVAAAVIAVYGATLAGQADGALARDQFRQGQDASMGL